MGPQLGAKSDRLELPPVVNKEAGPLAPIERPMRSRYDRNEDFVGGVSDRTRLFVGRARLMGVGVEKVRERF